MTSLRHNIEPDGEPVEPRDLYLDAARACLLDVGWRRTTLTEVARRASVSRMTIYRTWADMPRLLSDLMTREWTGVVAAAVGTVDVESPGKPASSESSAKPADTALPRVERLVDTIAATVRGLRSNELFVRIVELDPELVLPYLLTRRGRSQDLVLGLVEDQVRAGQLAGEVREGDPTTIARGVLLAVHGFVLSAHTMVDDAVDESAVDAELRLLLERGLRP